MTLNKYIVPITCTITQHIEVIAENEDDATEQACGMFNPADDTVTERYEVETGDVISTDATNRDYVNYEMRSCLEFDGGTIGYSDYSEFYTQLTALQERAHIDHNFKYKRFWTVYGITKEGLCDAIKDFDCQVEAVKFFDQTLTEAMPKPEYAF